MLRPWLIACLVVVSAGCNDHRYGFFGNEEGSGGESTSTTGPDPTTVSPTTVSTITAPDPTVPDPTTTTTTTDPTDPSGPGTVTVTTSPTVPTSATVTTDPTGMPGVCGEEPLASVVPLSTFTDNTGLADQFAMPCIDSFGPDAVWVWTAPFDGVFRFDTVGSSLDTVLTVFEGYCGGGALGCNDDTVQLWSQVDAELLGGTTVTAVVEGLGGQVGHIALNITAVDEPPPPPCTLIDIGSQLGEFFGDTQFGSDVFNGSCVGVAAPELAFLWTAPFPGTFRLRTFGSNFDPALYVRVGDCDGIEIACNDDDDGLEPQVDIVAAPSDGPLVIFVDGAGQSFGTFTLAIAAL